VGTQAPVAERLKPETVMSQIVHDAAAAQTPPFPTERYRALDAAHHIHPFSDMGALNRIGSRVITHGRGIYLWDSEGNRLIDGMSGLWCVNVGYGHETLAAAAYRQMLELPYYNTFFKTTHPRVTELSALLAELAGPAFTHFFYGTSGSESNDTVLRIAYRYWATQGEPQKKFVIARKNGYHGSTIAGATLGGMSYMHEQMPSKLENVVHIDQPYFFAEAQAGMSQEAFGLERARQLEAKILELGPENVAAFIGEPFQGAGGVIIPPDTYWPEIERICRRYDVLLVADEVIGGFGRTGEWFSHRHFGFRPDLMTLAKGITSGYVPLSAVALSERVARAIVAHGEFNHGMTYSGHPVAAAVAIANLRLLRDEGIVDRVRTETGPYFQRSLREALDGHPIVGDIDGVGLVAGIQLAQERATRTRFPDGHALAERCRDFSFDHHLVMRASGDRMLLAPPLVITRSEIDELVDNARHALDAAAATRQR
jgi:putrescine aminotransferase